MTAFYDTFWAKRAEKERGREREKARHKKKSVQNESLVRNCAASSKIMSVRELTPISFFISLFFPSNQTEPTNNNTEK